MFEIHSAVMLHGLGQPILSEIFQNNKPLWSQTNELICSGVSRFNCTESNCEKGDSSALWKVDFPGQKITFLGQIKMEYIIQDRFFN